MGYSLKILFFAFAILLCFPSFGASKKGRTIGDMLSKIEKKSKKINLRKAKVALPKSGRNRFAKRKKVNLSSIKPPSAKGLAEGGKGTDAELEKYTDAEIKQLYKLTQNFKRSKRRGEIWLRLAEAYVDKARILEYRLRDNFDKKMKAYQSKKRKSRPRLNLKVSQQFNEKAIKLYEWFLRDFPKDSK